jgi:hypothetical protein
VYICTGPLENQDYQRTPQEKLKIGAASFSVC